jgi:polyisoprenoid-binding protein YceI
VFEGDYARPLKTPYGGEITVGFSGSVKDKQEDFGILWGSELMEGGGLIAGKEVQIFLDVEADLAE